jgi:hypothetical protein
MTEWAPKEDDPPLRTIEECVGGQFDPQLKNIDPGWYRRVEYILPVNAPIGTYIFSPRNI